mmetsp:Transcript_48940/g.72755  ORF Transcript_48940/g.72755 Transcript_48940/m.72755 type:complete len:236 (+) Transcript_48940:196-903(+)
MAVQPTDLRNFAWSTSASPSCIAETVATITEPLGIAPIISSESFSTTSTKNARPNPESTIFVTSSGFDTCQINSTSLLVNSSAFCMFSSLTNRTTAVTPAETASLTFESSPLKMIGHGPGKFPLACSCSLENSRSACISAVQRAAALTLRSCIESVARSIAFSSARSDTNSKQTAIVLLGFFSAASIGPDAVFIFMKVEKFGPFTTLVSKWFRFKKGPEAIGVSLAFLTKAFPRP